MNLSTPCVLLVAGISLAGCTKSVAPPVAAPSPDATAPAAAPAPAAPAAPAALAAGVRAVALPGAPPEGYVMMDYIAYDAAHHQIWVPAGNTASVDVIDTADDKLTRLDGFATQETERKGKKRTVGPSAAAVGGDVIYIGNRGDSSAS